MYARGVAPHHPLLFALACLLRIHCGSSLWHRRRHAGHTWRTRVCSAIRPCGNRTRSGEPMVTWLPRVVYTERPTVAEIDTARTIDEGTTYATDRESGTDHRRCCRCRRTINGLWWGGGTALRPRRCQGGVD